jgi:hypothetical protein
MNVEIRAEAAQFPAKEYINGIAVAVQVQQVHSCTENYHRMHPGENPNRKLLYMREDFRCRVFTCAADPQLHGKLPYM